MIVKAIKKWEDCQRDDLNMIPIMIANGFTPIFSYADRRAERTTYENCPHHAVGFGKADFHVWKVYPFALAGSHCWMTADLICGSYQNHKTIKELHDLFI